MRLPTVIDIPEVTNCGGQSLSQDFYDRLWTFYHEQDRSYQWVSPIWNGMLSGPLFPLKQALDERNMEDIKHLLNSLYFHDLVYGLDIPGPRLPKEFFAQELASLAYAQGCVSVLNKNQDKDTPISYAAIYDRVMSFVKPELLNWPGQSGGVPGVRVGYSFMPLKLIEGLSMKTCVDRVLPQTHCTVEIGGGMGFDGYTFTRGIGRWYSIDLPLVSVMQGFLLASAVGEQQVSFAGESSLSNVINICGVRPCWNDMGDIDLILNRNSLPEIPFSVGEQYLKAVESQLSEDGIFFSVNHESNSGDQVRVTDLVHSATDWNCYGRFPWWPMAGIMEGYVCEIFKP